MDQIQKKMKSQDGKNQRQIDLKTYEYSNQ